MSVRAPTKLISSAYIIYNNFNQISIDENLTDKYSDQSEEKAEIKTNTESDYESEYSIYFPEKSDPELDYGSESVYHYRWEVTNSELSVM